MKNSILFLLPIMFISLTLSAQLSETETKQIDSLFVQWNTPDHPGGAVGIMKKGKVVYSKAFGLASLEYRVANTDGTIFNTGSISKQFTAMGIVVLHLQGLLSVDDDIRKYLPDLPDFGHTITIRHMLHHTSGMRSLHAMLALAGWRGDDSRTNEDLYRFMLKQQELNFTPGDEFLYCNTGYMLMVNIIEEVTKEKFPDWMKANIFEPLGMDNTYVEDRYDRIVANNATSYKTNKGDFYRAVEYWGYVGSGNTHSTVNDLLKWLNNFSSPKPDWSEAFAQLISTDKLNDESDNNYAFGVVIGNVYGHNNISHGGAIGGFRAFVSTFPDEQLSIAMLTNFSLSNVGQKVNQLNNILLPKKDDNKTVEEKPEDIIATINLPEKQLKAFEADYWNDKYNYTRKIYVENDTLHYFRSETRISPLVPIASNKFKMLGVDTKLIVEFDSQNPETKSMTVTIEDGTPLLFHSYQPLSNPNEQVKQYAGRFYSPELESTIDILVRDSNLVGHHGRHGDFPMKILKSDILQITGVGIAKVKRDANNTITGIRISNGRARNVWFEKQD